MLRETFRDLGDWCFLKKFKGLGRKMREVSIYSPLIICYSTEEFSVKSVVVKMLQNSILLRFLTSLGDMFLICFGHNS